MDLLLSILVEWFKLRILAIFVMDYYTRKES